MAEAAANDKEAGPRCRDGREWQTRTQRVELIQLVVANVPGALHLAAEPAGAGGSALAERRPLADPVCGQLVRPPDHIKRLPCRDCPVMWEVVVRRFGPEHRAANLWRHAEMR